MTKSKYDVERSIQIFNNDSSEFLHVGPDRYAVGGVEIRCHDGSSAKPTAAIFMTPEQAVLVGKALLELYDRGQPAE